MVLDIIVVLSGQTTNIDLGYRVILPSDVRYIAEQLKDVVVIADPDFALEIKQWTSARCFCVEPMHQPGFLADGIAPVLSVSDALVHANMASDVVDDIVVIGGHLLVCEFLPIAARVVVVSGLPSGFRAAVSGVNDEIVNYVDIGGKTKWFYRHPSRARYA